MLICKLLVGGFTLGQKVKTEVRLLIFATKGLQHKCPKPKDSKVILYNDWFHPLTLKPVLGHSCVFCFFMPSEILQTHFPPLTSFTPYCPCCWTLRAEQGHRGPAAVAEAPAEFSLWLTFQWIYTFFSVVNLISSPSS